MNELYLHNLRALQFHDISKPQRTLISKEADSLFRLADIWRIKGRLDRAILGYKNVLKIQPDCLRSYQRLGWLLTQKGQFESAIDCYTRALVYYPNLEWIHKLLIQIFIKTDGIERAFNHYNLEQASDKDIQVQPHTIICCMVVRNESLRLPYWLDYYRHLGVGQFFIVNNDSTDSTEAYLRSQPDVALWNSSLSFNQANFGSAWFEVLLQRYGVDRWCLTVDADEILYYPNCETRSLNQLCSDLDREYKRAFSAVLLDMYSDVDLEQTKYHAGQNPLDVCSYFDRHYYHRSWLQESGPNQEQICYVGGMRERVFGNKSSYYLSKVPLIKYHPDMLLYGGQHFIGTFEDQLSTETGALLHFKYIHTFKKYVADEIDRKEHCGDALDYQQYAKKVLQEGVLSFYDSRVSIQFQDSQQLVGLGVIRHPGKAAKSRNVKAKLRETRKRESCLRKDFLVKPYRILLYTNRTGIYGVGRWNHKIAMTLHDAGYDVYLAQPEPPSADAMFSQRVKVGIRHSILRSSYAPQAMTDREAKDWSEPFRIINDIQPDAILFANGEPFSNLTAMEVARQQKIPYTTVIHCVAENWKPWADLYHERLSNAYQSAQAVVAVSQVNLQQLHQYFCLDESLGEVILYGIDNNFFKARNPRAQHSIREQLDLPADAIVSLTAARLDRSKGYQYQISAIHQLLKEVQGPDLHFVWAGAGSYEAELKKQIQVAGIGDRIHFLGERHDIPALLDAADLFVLPSEFEGMPLAILEAMAKGLPIIASAVSGIPEALGETGSLLPDPNRDPEGTVAALTAQLKQWLNQPSSMQALGNAARQRAQELFREERMFEQYIEKLNQMR